MSGEIGIMIWGGITEYYILPGSRKSTIEEMHKEYLEFISGRDKERAMEISKEIREICMKRGRRVGVNEIKRVPLLFTFYLRE